MGATEMNGEFTVSRIYKDTLFRRLFGDERHKRNAMSLYNALGGSCTNPDELIFTTIEGVIYMGRKNDVSFLVDGNLVLWEHQSTFNPNMPLRGLIHLAQLYNKYLDLYSVSLYSAHRITLPAPQYYVFYAGPVDMPDRTVLRLSDSFVGGAEGACAEMVTTVLNINEGHNKEIMEACEALSGYAHLLSLARGFARSMDRAKAVDLAVGKCIDEGVLADFLSQNRAEVIDLFLTEWDEEKYRDLIRKEAAEASYKDGYDEGHGVGYDEGHGVGYDEGHGVGYDEGHGVGYDEGHGVGYDEGRAAGRAAGRAEGYDEGHGVGYDEGHGVGYDEGHGVGYDEGYKEGRAEAYAESRAAGRAEEYERVLKAAAEKVRGGDLSIEVAAMALGCTTDEISAYMDE